ncbi:MAG TPA: biotin/lipoyl-containing protein, partial [Mycobacteriales bacterium]
MAVSVTMPRLGESVSEGTVTRWLKQEGDHVEADEPLLEVSTDKVDTEIPSPASGTLTKIVVQEDETVDVGVELATIGDADAAEVSDEAPADDATPPEPEQAADAPEPEPPAAAESAPEPPPASEEPAAQAAPEPEPTPEREAPAPPAQTPPRAAPQPPAPTSSSDESYVTPLVRKLASEHGVDLASVTGTGIGGRIRKQDVLDAAGPGGRTAPAAAAPAGRHAAPSAPAPTTPAQAAQAAPETQVRGKTEKLSRLREVIATRMVESLQISAQLTTVVEADVTGIAKLREAAKDDFEAREGVRLTFLPFFALATIEAL